jgi:hypothetical protein
MTYEYWKSALAGEKPKMFVDDPQCGFYRKGIYERNDKGNKKRTGWTPVAIFMVGETMVGRVGGGVNPADLTDDNLNTLWSFCCANPISEETYRAVAEKGERWPDDPAPPEHKEPAKSPDEAIQGMAECDYWNGRKSLSGIGHNDPPKVMTVKDHATAIANAIGAAPKVTDEISAGQALGSKNRIAELRLACDKAGRAEYEPLYATYVKVRDPWQAEVKKAADKEKAINTDILKFREAERQRIAKEQAAADAKQRLIEAANAQRETPLPVLEVAPVAAPAPIIATYGKRGLKEEEKYFLDEITSYDDVYKHFRDAEPMKAFLKLMAGQAVKRGEVVPGTKTHKGLV